MSKRKEGVSRLFELAGKKKTKLVAASVLSVISSLSRVIFFFTIYGVIREVLLSYSRPQNINMDRIYMYSCITLAGIILYGICAYKSSALAHTAAYDLLYEIRIQLMEKMTKISMGYFTGVTQGAIKKIMTDDVDQIEVFVAHNLSDMTAAIATPLFTILYLFYMDWRLALITLLPILISLILLGTCLKQKDKAVLQKEMHDAMERMTGTIVEFIHGIPVVKVFNRSLGAFGRYKEDIDSFVDVVDRTAKANSAPMGWYYVFFGAQLLFLLPASILLIQREANFNQYLLIVILFLIVGQGLKEPLENMMNMAIGTNRIKESIKRIDGILYQEEMKVDGNGSPASFDVSFNNISFAYDENRDVLKNISFHAEQGSINAIVGPSGGGKTTMLELLLHFYPLNKGSIKIGGVDIKDIPQNRLMDLISYVFQESVLFSDTIENNIRMGNNTVSMDQVIEAAKNASIHDVIMKLPKGYQTVVGEDNAYLSGGEKQRIAIARLFLKNSPIVVMDEATAYADAENESKIQKAFAKLSKNKTVFIIAHRIKTIENADKILVLQDGSIAGCGTHKELYANCDLYKDMVEANERRDTWTIKNEGEVQCYGND